MKKFLQVMKAIKMELSEHRSSFLVYMVLRVMVIAVMVLQVLNENYENVFLCVLTLLILIIPSFIQVQFKIEFPSTLEIIMLLFIFAAEILGEIREFYVIYPFWDTMLHTLNGFLAAAIGFSLVDLLNQSERTKFHLSPVFLSIVAFCFSMTIGVIWEFFEFGVDTFLGFDMQKDTIVHAIRSVMLDPAGGNRVYQISDIQDVIIHGQSLGLGGYLDIGLLDTNERPACEFCWGSCLFDCWIYLCKKPWKRYVCPEIYSQEKTRRSGLSETRAGRDRNRRKIIVIKEASRPV